MMRECKMMKNKINFYDGFIQDDVIWFSNLNHNALMTLNLKNGQISSIARFPGCESYRNNLHIRVIENNGKLYFVPRNGNFVHAFSLEKMLFEENISLPYLDNNNIANAIIDKCGRIWIIPAYFKKGIVILNTNDKSAERFNKTDLLHIAEDAFIGPNCVSYNKGVISICIFKSNVLIHIDTSSEEIKYEELDARYKPYSFISRDGVIFYFSNYPDNKILSWNKNEKKYTVIFDGADCEAAMYMYWNYIQKGNEILCIPCDNNDLSIVDIYHNKKKHIRLNQIVKRNSCNALYSFYREYKGQIYLFPSGADGLLIINCDDWSIDRLNYVISDDLREQIQAEYDKNFRNEMLSGIVSETIAYDESLDEFLNYVTENKICEDLDDKPDCGDEIYERTKRIIS